MSETDVDIFEIDGATFSLADIGGIDLESVKEVRAFNLPEGIYHFGVEKAQLTSRQNNEGVKKPIVAITVVVKGVKTLMDDEIDKESLVGRKHTEAFWITNPVEDIGRVKALLVDTGFSASGNLQEVLAQFEEHEFIAPIRHKPNPNDKDNPYANIMRNKVMSMEAYNAAMGAA